MDWGDGIPPPPERQATRLAEAGTQDDITIEGNFEKVRLRPLRRFGMYRRGGSIEVTPRGLTISGRHVFPVTTRLLIGVPLSALTLVVGYGVVEYVLLVTEDLFVPWNGVEAFVIDRRQSRVGLAFRGSKESSPIVFRTSQAEWIYASLQSRIPDKDLGEGVVKGRPLLVLALIIGGTAAITLILAMLGGLD